MTRRHHTTRKSKKQSAVATKSVMTIPELRRSFEGVEEMVNEMVHDHQLSKAEMVKMLQKEWKHIFHKDLSDEMADTFLESRIQAKKSTPRRRITSKRGRHSKGGMAPLDSTTRAGVYETPGGAAAASYSNYLYGGFIAPPAIAMMSDPVKGQAEWPVVPKQMGGCGSCSGGRKKTPRRRGGSLLQQMIARPFGGSSPASIGTDMQDMWNGKSPLGATPPIQPTTYQLGDVYSRQATV